MISQSGVGTDIRRRYDSSEGILKSLESWRKFWDMVQKRREAAERQEALSWFLVWGRFELREDGICLAWKPELSGVTDDVLRKEEFLKRGKSVALKASTQKYIVVPPAILRCLVCGHIFRRGDSERINKRKGFLSLENFVGVSLRRAIARMVNPTSSVYSIPIRTSLMNRGRRTSLNLLDSNDGARMVCSGDCLEIDFFRFAHDTCGSVEGVAYERSASVLSEASRKKPGRKRSSSGKKSPSQNPKGNADGDVHDWYRKKVGAFRLLDAEEEQVLARRIQEGDTAALQDLVHANLQLAFWVALRFWRRCPYRDSIELDDVIQEANMALLGIAAHFEERGIRFSTYATVSIKRHLRRNCASLFGVVYVPPHVQWQCVQFSRALEIFLQGYDRGEAVARAAAKAGISIRMARNFAEMYMDGMMVPLDDDDDDRCRSLYECIPDESLPVEDLLADEECRGIVQNLYGSLANERRVSILADRVGLNSEGTKKTLERIGQEEEITRGWVWQLEVRGKTFLRKVMERKGYSRGSFFDE